MEYSLRVLRLVLLERPLVLYLPLVAFFIDPVVISFPLLTALRRPHIVSSLLYALLVGHLVSFFPLLASVIVVGSTEARATHDRNADEKKEFHCL